MPEWFWIIPALLVFAIAAGIAASAKRRRKEALQRAGADLGLELTEEANVLSKLSQLELFQGANSRLCKHVMRGAGPHGEALLFDYWYDTGVRGDRDPSNSHEQTVAAFRFAGANLPKFEVSPETLFARMASKLGAQDFNFDSHPDFSSRFSLRGADEPAVRSLFDPAVLGFFEELEKSRRCIVEGRGEWLIVYRKEKRVKPSGLRTFFDEASAVARVFGSRAPAFRRTSP